MSNTFRLDLLPESLRDLLVSRYERLDDEKDRSILQLKAVFSWLCTKFPDLMKIEIVYQGSGDSGCVERIDAEGLDESIKQELFRLHIPSEIAFNHNSKQGHWCQERREWIAKFPGQTETVDEALDRIGWDIAYGQNPGFEINEGGFGTVSVYLDDDLGNEPTVQLDHTERYESTNDYFY